MRFIQTSALSLFLVAALTFFAGSANASSNFSLMHHAKCQAVTLVALPALATCCDLARSANKTIPAGTLRLKALKIAVKTIAKKENWKDTKARLSHVFWPTTNTQNRIRFTKRISLFMNRAKAFKNANPYLSAALLVATVSAGRTSWAGINYIKDAIPEFIKTLDTTKSTAATGDSQKTTGVDGLKAKKPPHQSKAGKGSKNSQAAQPQSPSALSDLESTSASDRKKGDQSIRERRPFYRSAAARPTASTAPLSTTEERQSSASVETTGATEGSANAATPTTEGSDASPIPQSDRSQTTQSAPIASLFGNARQSSNPKINALFESPPATPTSTPQTTPQRPVARIASQQSTPNFVVAGQNNIDPHYFTPRKTSAFATTIATPGDRAPVIKVEQR